MKRSDWIEYSEIEADGKFPILEDRLREESEIKMLQLLDEDLEELCRLDHIQDNREFDEMWEEEVLW